MFKNYQHVFFIGNENWEEEQAIKFFMNTESFNPLKTYFTMFNNNTLCFDIYQIL